MAAVQIQGGAEAPVTGEQVPGLPGLRGIPNLGRPRIATGGLKTPGLETQTVTRQMLLSPIHTPCLLLRPPPNTCTPSRP